MTELQKPWKQGKEAVAAEIDRRVEGKENTPIITTWFALKVDMGAAGYTLDFVRQTEQEVRIIAASTYGIMGTQENLPDWVTIVPVDVTLKESSTDVVEE